MTIESWRLLTLGARSLRNSFRSLILDATYLRTRVCVRYTDNPTPSSARYPCFIFQVPVQSRSLAQCPDFTTFCFTLYSVGVHAALELESCVLGFVSFLSTCPLLARVDSKFGFLSFFCVLSISGASCALCAFESDSNFKVKQLLCHEGAPRALLCPLIEAVSASATTSWNI